MEKKKTSKIGIIIFIVIVIIIAYFILKDTKEVTDTTANNNDLNYSYNNQNEKSGDWHYFKGFSGPPTETYYTFKTIGSKFKIIYDGNFYEGSNNFMMVYLFKLGGSSINSLYSKFNISVVVNNDKTTNYTINNNSWILTQSEYSAVLGNGGNASEKVKEIRNILYTSRYVTLINEKLEYDMMVQGAVKELYNGTQKQDYSYLIVYIPGFEEKSMIFNEGPGEYGFIISGNNLHNWNAQIEDFY